MSFSPLVWAYGGSPVNGGGSTVTAKACVVTARHGRRVWACPASVSAVRFFEGCAVFPVALCHRWAVFRRGCPPFTLRGLLVGRRLSPTVPTLAPLGVEPRGAPFGLGRSSCPCPVGGSIASDPLGWARASALSLRSGSVFKVRSPSWGSCSVIASLPMPSGGDPPSGRSVVPDCILSIANSSFYDIYLSCYDNFLLCFRYLVS